MNRISTLRFGMRGLMGIIAGCALVFWLYSDLIPAWRDYRRLSAAVHVVDERSCVIPFGDLIVNLSDPGTNRYLRLSFSLKVDKPNGIVVSSVVLDRNDEVRDWLIEHLSEKQAQELTGGIGIRNVREEMKDGINDIIGATMVSRVLITDCTIQ